VPGLAYIGNFTFLQLAIGYILGRIVVAYTLLPRYYQGQLVTAYALLEQRFGLGTRRFASVIFMVTRAFADSVRVFATAIPIALILSGAVPHPVFWAVLILGILTVFYTYHGGMRAVVWTDVVQTCVYLVGGISAIILLGVTVAGGWPAILHGAAAAGKLQVFDMSLHFNKPYTLAAGVIGGAFLSMASHGADQLIVQRLLAAENLRDARRALIGSGLAVLFQFALFLTIGTGLYAYYGGRHFATPDAVFPGYILERMPHGLIGLIVAAILAATMSTHSGAINSLAASTTHDIYLPLTGIPANDPRVLKMAKRFTLFWGFLLTAGALLYPQQGTSVVTVALAIASFTYGGLLGGFFLAMLWRRAIQRDAILGMALGILAMTVVVFYKPVSSLIAWPWYVLIGSTITVAVGIASSYTHADQ
jgi:solute:Na+ symporter, SSS family